MFEDISVFFPDWWEKAACRSHSKALFFGSVTKPSNISKAREICRVCPVMRDCLDQALTYPEDYGVWAGTSVLDRNNMKSMCEDGDTKKVVQLHIEANLKWSKRE